MAVVEDGVAAAAVAVDAMGGLGALGRVAWRPLALHMSLAS